MHDQRYLAIRILSMRVMTSRLIFIAIAAMAVFTISCSDEAKPALNHQAKAIRLEVQKDADCIAMTKNIGTYAEANKAILEESGKSFLVDYDYKKASTYWWYLELANDLRAIVSGVKACTGDQEAKANALNALNSLKTVDGWDKAIQIGESATL